MLRALTTPRHSPRDLSGSPSHSDREFPLDVLHAHWSHYAADLLSRDEDCRSRAASELRRSVEQDLQSMTFDDSSRLVDDLTNRVFDLVNSSETVEKLGGLTLLQQLLTMRAEQHDTILLRCMNVFRILFQQATLNAENRVIDLAARVLGFLCHTGAALTIDVAHYHIRQALDWLSTPSSISPHSTTPAAASSAHFDRIDRRHLAAVYILRELSGQSPAIFASYIPQFSAAIWQGLKDARPETREASVAAVRNVLMDVSKRSPLLFANTCEQLYDESRSVIQNLSSASPHPQIHPSASASSLSVPSSPMVTTRQVPRSPQPVHSQSPVATNKRTSVLTLPALHASFLVLTQLVLHNRQMMLAHFTHVCELAYKHRDTKDQHVTRALLQLLPLLASLRVDSFLSSQAEWMVDYILQQASAAGCVNGDLAMAALSQLMGTIGEGMVTWVEGVVAAVMHVLASTLNVPATVTSNGGANGSLLSKRKDKEREAERLKRLKRTSEAALECVGVMAKYLSLSFYPFADQLLDSMLRCPLSPALISSLSTITTHVPALTGDIQERLADMIINVLSTPFMDKDRGAPAIADGPSATSAIPMHGHGHSYSVSSFSALSSFSATTSSMSFLPLASPSSSQSPNNSFTSPPPSPLLPPPAVDINKPNSPYQLPRHLQLHRLLPYPTPSLPDTELVLLAFSTLSTFSFSFATQFSLLALARYTMLNYMDDDNLTIRREAAVTTLQLISKIAEAIAATYPSNSVATTSTATNSSSHTVNVSHLLLVCYDVVRKLIVLAVTDQSLNIRSSLLSLLVSDTRLDRFLLQSDLLSTLFLALHDEYSAIREAAILLLGRLSTKNPAVILPTLRRMLLLLLGEMQAEEVWGGGQGGVRGGGEGRRGLSQEEGAKMLGQLIGSCHALIKPYVDSILGVLVPKLGDREATGKDGQGGDGSGRRKRSEGLISSVLSTLGKLSVICGEDMTPFLDHLMPLLLEALYPPHMLHASATAAATTASPASVALAAPTTAPAPSSSDHKQMTLRTLSLLLSSTSSVIAPFIRYPHFLPCLLHLVRTDKSKAVRLECLRVIGVVGAIDPFEYRKCQSEWVAVMGESGGGSLNSVSQGHGDGRMPRRGTSDSMKSTSVQVVPSIKTDKDKVEVKDEAKRDEAADNAVADGLPGGSPLTRQAQPGEARPLTEDDDVQHDIYLCQFQSYDEYYPSVAIASLMRVIVDPRLLSHHSLSLGALMFILKSLGRDKCQPFLASIVPVFLREMRSCDDVLRESYLQQLSSIVQLVGGGVKEWVEEMMDLALHFWPLPAVVTGLTAPIAPVFTASAAGFVSANAPPPLLVPILSLFEHICVHLPSFFPTHLPVLLAKFLSLFADYPTEQNIGSARCVLASLSVFSAHADLTAHLHFILPSLLDLCEEEDERSQRRPINLRIDAVHAVGQLCYHHDCSSQASRILQPFARILASPTNPAGHVLPTTYSAVVSASGASVPHSVASSTHGSPTIRSVGLSASLLWSETLSAVCTIIPQLSFAFLLFEPIVTRAIREHERVDRPSTNPAPNGSSHPGHERTNSRLLTLDGKGLSRADSDMDREGVWKEKEATQVTRYFTIVERLKEKLRELKRTSQRAGTLKADDEDGELQREKERELQERVEREKDRDKERRRKDRRSTMGRMASHAEKDRDKERERELAAERERREQLRDKERDTIAFFPVIASASSLSMDDLDESGYLPSPVRFNASPGTSPAWQASHSPPPVDGDSLPPLSLSINQQTLVRFFSSYHHSSTEDWTTWLRSLQLELLRESPSFALRACSSLAGKYPPVARELMCSAFLSCWRDMDDQVKDQIIDAVINILTAATQPQPIAVPVPADIVLSILSLSDYCEQHDQRLPLRHRLLGAAAERYHSHARALYHYECLFRHNPSTAIEPLILVNNKLQLNDAAQGVLAMALRYEGDGIGEQWYEKLHRWDDALAAYERRQLLQADQGDDEDALMGRMRCMKELQQWERLAALGSSTFLTTDDVSFRSSIAPLVSAAVHQLRCWDLLEPYLPYLSENTFDGCYYRALYALHMEDSAQAQQYIDRACECVDGQLSGLLGESYTRAYGSIVRLQQCTELSEMIAYKSASEDKKAAMRRMWSTRLLGARKSVGVWSELLSVRALVMTPKDDVGLWLEYATLARKSGKLALSLKVLTALVGFEPTLLVSQPPAPLPTSLPQLTYACLKHLYAAGHQRSAFTRLSELLNSDTMTAEESRAGENEAKAKLRARCYLKLGTWQMELMGDELSVTNFMSYEATSVLGSPAMSSMRREREDDTVVQRNAAYNAVLPQVLNYFHAATVCDPTSFAAWHQYAMLNFTVVQRNKQRQAQLSQRSSMQSSAASSTLHSKRGSIITLSGAERGRGIGPSSAASSFVGSANLGSGGGGGGSHKLLDIHHHIVPAMTGFFRSIWLQKFGDNSRQDVLRVLQLWFEYGARKDVEQAMIAGINSINIDTWLAVIPQLIARLHTPYLSIRALLHELIAKIGKTHPQALVYPLVVASKSHSDSRRVSAMHVLQAIRQHSEKLVNQASMVSSELVRVAILWHELWHEAIEEASRHWFGNKSADGMLATLAPLHAMMEKGPTTTAEQQFAQQYGAELHAAHNCCNRYLHTSSTHFLTKAWEIYSDVFRSINKSLQLQQHIQLAEVSPKLLNAHDLQLAVPGSYTAAAPIVRIARFHPLLRVIDSKQHPRRLTIVGNDGREYPFLLKGHEDLRQDERVMQLFGMVNTFLQLDRSTARSELSIVRYAVIPLSPNSGLIQWVPACDTLHALIKQYRDAKRIQLNVEQRLMLKQAPDYQLLTTLQKVEVFQYALLNTSEFDLARALYLRARSAERWLDQRQTYTRSLAVMSMIGYVLGLGDRHPCNLMVERHSGAVVHIDFGDCFDVAQLRDKYPEKVPFRLTRMMVAAMDCGALYGSYVSLCSAVMATVRKNKNSVMALLEAFVYDPLLSWRLLDTNKPNASTSTAGTQDNTQPTSPHSPLSPMYPPPPQPLSLSRRQSSSTVTASRRPSTTLSLYPPTASHSQAVEVGTNPASRDRRRSIIAVSEDEEREKRLDEGRAAEEDEELNERAVAVIARIGRKLRGTDFDDDRDERKGDGDKEDSGGSSREGAGDSGTSGALDVQVQVDRLIREATSHINLCQSYIGWCGFW